MLHYNIIQEFEGKNVEVTTIKRDFSGTLKYDVTEDTLIVTPTDPWTVKRYGPAIIVGKFVVAIREILPCVTVSIDDGDDYDTDKKSESKG
jgi:hypothetical protein